MGFGANFRIFFLSGLLLLSTACSVYKSTGRKAFEAKASETVSAMSVAQTKGGGDSESSDVTCWNQLASEPLWHVDAQNPLIVTQINDDEIQVCLQAP